MFSRGSSKVKLPSQARRAMRTGHERFAEHGEKYGGAEDYFFQNAGVGGREAEISTTLSRSAALDGASMVGANADTRMRPPGSSANTLSRMAAVNKASRHGADQAGNLSTTLEHEDRDRKMGALRFGRGSATAVQGQNNQTLSDLASRDIQTQQIRDAQKTRNLSAGGEALITGMGGLARLADDAEAGQAGDGTMDKLGDWLYKRGFTAQSEQDRETARNFRELGIQYNPEPGFLSGFGRGR